MAVPSQSQDVPGFWIELDETMACVGVPVYGCLLGDRIPHWPDWPGIRSLAVPSQSQDVPGKSCPYLSCLICPWYVIPSLICVAKILYMFIIYLFIRNILTVIIS